MSSDNILLDSAKVIPVLVEHTNITASPVSTIADCAFALLFTFCVNFLALASDQLRSLLDLQVFTPNCQAAVPADDSWLVGETRNGEVGVPGFISSSPSTD